MSLKSFHVFFIVMAVLSSMGFALWAFTLGGAEFTSGLGLMGLSSAAMGCGLAGYGFWFVLKKSGRLII